MPADTTPATPPQAADAVAELLPQAGGSYTRQPDGSLLPTAPATEQPNQPE